MPAVGLSLLAGNPPATAQIVLQLEPEIDCSNCEHGIKYLLQRRPGVRSVEVDVETSRVTVEYVPAQVSLTVLIATVGVPGLDYHARVTK
jgi:copper chaperone CopZ